jgi:hypothetical protein
VAALLPQVDLFALPSQAEGISNTLLEAMACGCAPVATGVGGNPELVMDGDNGSLVPWPTAARSPPRWRAAGGRCRCASGWRRHRWRACEPASA